MLHMSRDGVSHLRLLISTSQFATPIVHVLAFGIGLVGRRASEKIRNLNSIKPPVEIQGLEGALPL